MTTINPNAIAKSYAQDIMAEREYWSEDDLYDICHEHADGSQYVIYYSNAHDFVRSLSGSEESEAIDWLEDIGCRPDSYDDWAVKIAYAALHQMIYAEVLEMLENEEEAA